MTVLRAISMVLLCLAVAGCATDGAGLPSVACSVFAPITYSRKHDTRETIRQIVGHNAAGAKICGWKRPTE